MKFCFIYNKKASSGRKSNFIKKICNNLKLSHDVDLYETVTEKEAEDLFKQIVKQDYDRLVVAGGDGSVCFAINQLIKNNFQPKENFAIGYIPAGTANILQAELGMSNNINKISQTLMSDNLEKTNLVKINNNYFILMAGIGWDAQIVQSIDSKIKKILGKVIFGIKGLEKFIFMKNTKIKINIDNDELLADWVLCSNSRYYAGHHKITDTNIFEEKFITYIFKRAKIIAIYLYGYAFIKSFKFNFVCISCDYRF